MSTTATRLLDNYVGGQWTPATAASGALDVTNPATGEVLTRVPLSGAADLDAAVRAAREALPAWRDVATIARAPASMAASTVSSKPVAGTAMATRSGASGSSARDR